MTSTTDGVSPTSSGPVEVAVSGLHKSFGTLKVLRGIDLEIRKGQVVCVIGPSGAGKSTLLRCINLLEEPTAGTVTVGGIELTDPDCDIDAARRRIGMVFQQFNLFGHLTVLDNITLPQRRVLGTGTAEATQVARANLERVGLADKADAYPAQLSGGQQQRAAIARALAMEPKIMMFDEPTSALDPEMISEVLEVMVELAAEGTTMLVVTHEMGFARSAAHRVVFMDAGRIVETASPEQFFDHPETDRAKNFLSKILSH